MHTHPMCEFLQVLSKNVPTSALIENNSFDLGKRFYHRGISFLHAVIPLMFLGLMYMRMP